MLVVDDNATNRTIIHEQVVSWGMRNGSAASGLRALEMLREVPDLDTLVIAVGGGGLIGGMATAAKAIKLGYTNVKVVPEGYPAWAKAYGPGPTVSAAAAPAAKAPVMEAGKESGTISVASFERIY